MLKKRVVAFTAALALTGMGVIAAEVKPEDVVDYRQAMMIGLAWNIGGIGAMVKGVTPWDQQRVAFMANRAAQLATMPREGFTPETAKAKSNAKPEIWTNVKDFDERNDAMVSATAKLAEVAKAGDEAATKAAFVDTIKTCKGCHDKYQVKE